MGPGRRGEQGFGPERRLRRREEFLRVQSQGRKYVGHWLVFLYLKEEGVPCRLGITVSRRVGGAVVRNRVKRRIREIFRQNPALVEGLGALVVIARRSAREASFSDLEQDFFRLSYAVKKKPKKKSGQRSQAGRG